MKHKNKVRVLFLTLLVVLVGISFPQLRAAAAEVWNTEPITKLTYQVTINNSQGVTQFDWEATGSNWVAVNAQVPVKGDGSYSFSVELDYVSGMKNLGYISNVSREEEQDIAQLMTVTVNQITVNDKYALIYEVAPVLEPESGNNGISNIWNTAVGEKVCKSDNAYLALDQADGALTLYVKGEEEEFGQASASQKYVEAMGSGWNLGNSFDGFDADLSVEDGGETAWGNPMVTRELIQAVKAKGYKSIRIPMTVYRRYTVNESAGTDEYKYIINPDWLARYKQVVDWAVEEGMYVMVNIHHDSWIWLKDWNGSTDEEAYRMFTDFWKQIATYFASEPEQVCFETINEPQFSDEANAQSLLNAINLSAYNIIRGTAGNETRMIVMPTLNTNHEKGAPLAQLIKELNDEYIIATIHYYSEWVYSANLGKTGFDEELWLDGNGNSYTPRDAADSMMRAIVEQFVSKNIGVIVGEYGLLGYDTSEGCLQTGEELKYYEYMNAIARENKVCLMFWDNGSGIERVDGMYNWKQPLGGNMLEHSMSERSSYATGLDSIYFNHAISEDVNIPLTLNGNSFVEIEGLTEGVDYTYDAVSATVSLKASYVNSLYQNAGYGTMVDLIMKFNAGADWHEYLIKFTAPVISAATGTRSAGITIPVMFNGSKVRRMSAYEGDNRVGPNSSWWSYLQYDSAFHVNYAEGTLSLTSDFFADSSVGNGEMVLKVEYYDGQTVDIVMQIDGDKVNSVAVGKQPEESAEPSEEESTAPTEDEGTEVTVTQDGIQVTLTTDKKEYSQGEKITVSFTVTNTNDFDITNISLEALIPVGYQLSEDSNETMQLDSLAAGESVTFTVVFVAKKSDTGNHSGQNTGQNSNNPSAGTGDTNYAALWMVLLAAAMLAFEILLLKKRNGKHLFIILFGIAVGGIMLLGASTDVYAAKESKSIAISTVVNMNGNPLSIEAILKYDAVGEDESFDRYAMLNEDVTANEFVQLMGNGINLGNTMEAYGHVSPGIGQSTEIYETLWGQPVTTKEMIRGMKAAGFATIRIPIAWTNAMNFESGDYTIGEDYLNRVDEIINYALDEEMYVIINDHWDGSWWGRFGSASAETRAEAMEMYVSMWTQLAERYGMYGDHL
ncbi:MAG: cellulase family glycosylhydrolase, partial [Lachnospiraceae bacterium]